MILDSHMRKTTISRLLQCQDSGNDAAFLQRVVLIKGYGHVFIDTLEQFRGFLGFHLQMVVKSTKSGWFLKVGRSAQ